MKTSIKNLFFLPTLIAGLGLMLADRVTAQTFTTLHSFAAATSNFPYITNSDGARVLGGLILSGNSLYGTAQQGGSSGYGTLFRVNVDGSGFTNLHVFTGVGDSGCPSARLIISGNTLYGTAVGVGGLSIGSVFSINTNGTDFKRLHVFGGSDGANSAADLILSASTLYGTAAQGGSSGGGIIFGVNTDGTGFTNLHNFSGSTDGTFPYAGVISSGNLLYGTAETGGGSGNGTVFAVNTNGTGFTNLHSFTALVSNTNSDGVNPRAGLILWDNTLYGTTIYGGSSGNGTVFAVHTDGTGFTNLHSFAGTSDGANPFAALILAGNTLYGTTVDGGSFGNGSVFALHTDGTGFTNLHSFTAYSGNKNSDGAHPNASLILAGNTLYGTATYGGAWANGTVFSLSLPLPQLTIIPYGANVILTWPTNAAGFTLQSTTNLVLPTVWATVSPGPVLVNGQNAITNPISGTQRFYRLSQ